MGASGMTGVRIGGLLLAMGAFGLGGCGGEDSVDCSRASCAPAPVCGQSCDAVCGCCDCADGSMTTIDGTTYVCEGGCYVEAGGGNGDTCTSHDDCGEGLSCCYPCGVPGCDDVCQPTCDPSLTSCADGCVLAP